MAEQLPQNFIIPSEGSLASYDAEDIQGGYRLVTNYLSSYYDTSGKEYVISKLLNYSYNTVISMQEDGTQATNTYTYSFYTAEMLAPRILYGDFHFNFCAKGYASGGTGFSFQVKLYHYDG